MSKAAIAVLVLLGSSGPAFGQDRGSIEGTVTDAAGAAVPLAKVEIVQLDTNAKWSLDSNDTGRYYSPNMPLGQYRVTVHKDGFNTATSNAFAVSSQSNARVDRKLQVARSRERRCQRSGGDARHFECDHHGKPHDQVHERAAPDQLRPKGRHHSLPPISAGCGSDRGCQRIAGDASVQRGSGARLPPTRCSSMVRGERRRLPRVIWETAVR